MSRVPRLPKVLSATVAVVQQTPRALGVPVDPNAKHHRSRNDAQLGIFSIDTDQLRNNVISVRYLKTKVSVADFRRVELGDDARDFLFSILSGEKHPDTSGLSDEEKVYIKRLLSRSKCHVNAQEIFPVDLGAIDEVHNARRRLEESMGELEAGNSNMRDEFSMSLNTLLKHNAITQVKAERLMKRYQSEEE